MARIDLFHAAFEETDAPELTELVVGEPPPTLAGNDIRRGLKYAPLARNTRTYLSIDEGTAMIRDRINAYLNEPDPGRMLLVAAPAGIGKTSFAVEAAERWAAQARGRVLYAGPRKEFFHDIRAVSARNGVIAPTSFDAWWYAWQGRHDGEPETGFGTTCRWADQIHGWMQRGYTALDFCAQPRVCGWDYINTRCPYHRQRQQGQPIIFAQYEHVSMGHPLLDQCSLVIGDELPLRGFLYTTDDQSGWIIPPNAIVPDDTEPGPLRTMLRALQGCTTTPAPDATQWSGPGLLAELGGAAHVLRVCEDAQIPITAVADAPDVRHPYEIHDVPYFHLPQTLRLLIREARAAIAERSQISRVHVDRRGLHLLLRRVPANLPAHVVWLDATANAAMYRTLFQRDVEIVQPDVALTGHIFQMWASLNNKGQFLPSGEAGSEQSKQASVKIDHVRQQVSQIAARGYTRIGYIGHKGIIDRLVPEGTPAERIGHFGGNRGTNRFEACDCLIIVGAPQPTTAVMLDIAAMLYAERDDPFNATWSTRDIPFEGLPAAYPIGGFWNDGQLQILLDQFRDAELIQSVHRARPLRRNVDVWLLSNAPLNGLPVELVSLHQLFGAIDKQGRPLTIKDPYRWPAVVAWANTTADTRPQLVAPDFMQEFDITAPTARQWMAALVASGEWQYTAIIGARPGIPGKAICKAFRPAAN